MQIDLLLAVIALITYCQLAAHQPCGISNIYLGGAQTSGQRVSVGRSDGEAVRWERVQVLFLIIDFRIRVLGLRARSPFHKSLY